MNDVEFFIFALIAVSAWLVFESILWCLWSPRCECIESVKLSQGGDCIFAGDVVERLMSQSLTLDAIRHARFYITSYQKKRIERMTDEEQKKYLLEAFSGHVIEADDGAYIFDIAKEKNLILVTNNSYLLDEARRLGCRVSRIIETGGV